MEKQKLTREKATGKLGEYKGLSNDPIIKERVDFACYIIGLMSDEEVGKTESLKIFVDKFENRDSISSLESLDASFESVFKDLKNEEIQVKTSGEIYKADATQKELAGYVNGKKKRKCVSIAFLLLLVCGTIVTAVFAFLDNFNIIDYGGTAAGAAGIIDLVIGVIAFAVERINDCKTSRSMNAANEVKDEGSYIKYINIYKSFNGWRIIDKSKHYHESNHNHGDDDNGQS